MKKIIVTYGLISGGLITTFTLISMYYCYKSAEMSGSLLLGLSAMLLSFSLLFPAIKKYRDQYSNGSVSFGKAFLIAICIVAIASTMYVIGWLIEYHTIMPDFLNRFVDFSVRELEKSNLSPELLAAEKAQFESYRHNYDTLTGMILYTYVEIFPLGLIMALLAATIMKRPVGNSVEKR